MKKIAIILGILAVLAGLLIFIIPIIADPNQYRKEIEQEFSKATGYGLDIEGDISLSIFPEVKVYANKISLSNGSKVFAQVEQISAFMELMPIFSGEYKVKSVEIISPKLQLEKYENSNNWKSRKIKDDSASKSGEKSAVAGLPNASINDIRIVNGEVRYKDLTSGQEVLIDDISITSKLGSLNGPLNFKGLLAVEGEKINLGGEVKTFDNPQIIVGLGAYDSAFAYEGGLEQGKITFKTPNVNKVIEKLPIQNMVFPKPEGDFSANVEMSETQIKISDLLFNFGSSKGKGVIDIDLTGILTAATVDMSFDKLVVEDLMPKMLEQGSGAEEKRHAKTASSKNSQDNIFAAINLESKKLIYKKLELDNFIARAELDGKQLSLQPLKMNLPGGGKAEIFGVYAENSRKQKYIQGKIEANASDLAKLLKGLEVDTSAFKDNKLKNFRIDSDFYGILDDKPKLEFSNTNTRIDSSRFNGRFEVDMANEPVKISARGGIDRLNLDEILKPKPEAKKSYKQEKVSDRESNIDFSWLKNFPVQLNAALSMARFTLNDETFRGVQFSGIFKKNDVDIQKFFFKSDQLSASGRAGLNTSKTRPKIRVDVNVDNINTAYFIEGKTSATNKTVNKKGEAKLSEEPFDFRLLNQFDAEFKAKIEKFSHDRFSFKSTNLRGFLKDSNLVIEDILTYGFGGKLEVSGNIDVKDIPAVKMNYVATNLDIYRLARGLANIDFINGLISVSGNIESSGINQKNMVRNLAGSSSIAGTNIYVRGFGLESFINQVTDIDDAASLISILRIASNREATTYIRSLQGDIYTENGIAKTQSIKLDAGSAQGEYRGYADLNKWYMDTAAEFRLQLPDSKERPPLGIRVFGAIDNPQNDVDTSQIIRYITNRQAKRLIKKGVIPDKYQGAVEGFLGLDNEENKEVEQQEEKRSPEQELFNLFRGIAR